MEPCPYCEQAGTLPCFHIAITEIECPLCLGYGFVAYDRMAKYLTIIGYAVNDCGDWEPTTHHEDQAVTPKAQPSLFSPEDWK